MSALAGPFCPPPSFPLLPRYYQPEQQLLRTTVKLRNLPGAQAAYFAAAPGALRYMCAACSHPEVILGVGSSGLTAGPDRDELYLKYRVGPAPEVAHFYVLLYLDRLMARPVEVWRVFVHSLRKVDMRAMIGQTSQASVVVRGVVSRRVAAYTSHPDELQVDRRLCVCAEWSGVVGAWPRCRVTFPMMSPGF